MLNCLIFLFLNYFMQCDFIKQKNSWNQFDLLWLITYDPLEAPVKLNFQKCPFRKACLAGDTEKMKELYEKNQNIELHVDRSGWNGLHHASAAGQIKESCCNGPFTTRPPTHRWFHVRNDVLNCEGPFTQRNKASWDNVDMELWYQCCYKWKWNSNFTCIQKWTQRINFCPTRKRCRSVNFYQGKNIQFFFLNF